MGTRQTTELPPAPDTSGLVAQLDEQLAAAQESLREIDRARAAQLAHIEALRGSRAALLGRKRRPVAAAGTRTRSALHRAGRGNVDRVQALLRGGPATRSEIAERLGGMNNGTVTYALRHLEEVGEVIKTGERRKGSDEFAVAGMVSRPRKRS